MINNIIFLNNEHKSFYMEEMEKTVNDSYHKALVYLLGLTPETRNNFNTLVKYNGGLIPNSLSIKHYNMNEAWQTGTTYKITLLAFNLFNGFSYEYDDISEGDKRTQHISDKYTPYFLFCNPMAPYFIQAIIIKYPDYFRNTELNINIAF